MVQRVSRASVVVADEVVGNIGPGLLILLGVGRRDTEAVATRLATRVAGLRIFGDDAGRMNHNLEQHGGAALVVSQFTLYADASHGHRPSFLGAAPAELAVPLCDSFIAALRATGATVASGRFGAHMVIDSLQDGPVTLVLSSGEGPWAGDAG